MIDFLVQVMPTMSESDLETGRVGDEPVGTGHRTDIAGDRKRD